eukprot:g4557.t1
MHMQVGGAAALVVFCLLQCTAEARSDGAASCVQPGGPHGASSGAISFKRLSLAFDSRTASSSTPIEVEVGSTKPMVVRGATFKGFLIKGTGGATLTTSDGQQKDCGPDGAVTHRDAGSKTQVAAKYTAPAVVGDYALVITVMIGLSEWYQTSYPVKVVAKGAGTVTYAHSDGVRTFSINKCCTMGYCTRGTTKQQDCFLHQAVLDEVATANSIDMAVSHSSIAHLCNFQSTVCSAITEYQTNSAECGALKQRCKLALRHVHKMMFNQSPAESEPQVCNNFARKSIRGFFHDFMSNGIEGSILAEHHLAHNFGLCRWAQYVNVLSDETGCDPGSITAMAGLLGYQACGVHVWDVDVAVKPVVDIGRPFPCGANIATSPLFDADTGQRAERFSDVQLSANSTAMEEFWYAANGHTHRKPDGEVEYSAEAGAAAHAVGRVTCDPDGFDFEGKPASFRHGFFHKQRASGTLTAKQFFQEAMRKLRDTQCVQSSAGDPHAPADGRRLASAQWPLEAGETDINTEGGFCSMPTQFLGTVRVGGTHRIPRWASITQNSFQKRAAWSAHQSSCRAPMKLYLPWETRPARLSLLAPPSSAALAKFEAIAWDKVDSTNSAWDSCEVGCELPILENRLCSGAGAPALKAYDYSKTYCDQGLKGANNTCCAASCGACDDGAACAARVGGASACCPARIAAAAAECRSSWDTACRLPKTGDGGACAAGTECRSGVCKGGRCCNRRGQGPACAACSQLGGSCSACAVGYKARGPLCVDKCACSPGCVSCSCGTCTQCSSAHVLKGAECVPKVPPGAPCTADQECTSGRCAGKNCCDVAKLAAGCVDCNSRGLCSLCAAGYTLCGKVGSDEGNCKPTISNLETTFRCGTGGPATDYPSTDGYNYCAVANACPCTRGGCYFECKVPHTCWVGSVASTLTNYEPPEFKSATTVAPPLTTTAAPKGTTVAPACTQCADSRSAFMVDNNKECATYTWGHSNRCSCDEEWRKSKYCQKSCFEAGNGYAGDNCCTDKA